MKFLTGFLIWLIRFVGLLIRRLIIPVAVIVVIALVVITQVDLQKHHERIEKLALDKAGQHIDLQGETRIGFANFAPSLNVKKLSYDENKFIVADDLTVNFQHMLDAKTRWIVDKEFFLKAQARALKISALPFDQAKIPLVVTDNGVKSEAPFSARFYGGDVKGEFAALGNDVSLNLQAKQIKSVEIIPDMDLPVDIDIDLKSKQGKKFLSALNGTAVLTGDSGTLKGRAIELWGGDLIVGLLPGGGKVTDVKCIAIPLRIENGVAFADAVVMDTEKVLITGAGKIDLVKNKIEFVLRPKPKDPSLLNLATPVHIKGPMDNPKVSVSKMGVARKIGGLVLGVTVPVTLPLTFSNIGAGTNKNRCLAAVEKTLGIGQNDDAQSEQSGNKDAKVND